MTEHNTAQEKILKAIEHGEVKRHSRWYFISRTALLAVGMLITAASVIFLISFIGFALRQNGGLDAPTLGAPGIRAFVYALPWIIIILAIAFLGLLGFLVKHYQFSYKQPLLYSIVGIAILAIAGGFIMDRIHLHERLLAQAEGKHLSFGRGVYHHYGRPSMEGLTPCQIKELTAQGFIAITPREEELEIIITDGTKILSPDTFAVGDMVVVIGKRQGNTIQAEGIKETMGIVPPPKHRKPLPLE